jgi:dihydroorotate dehydrogenase (NAD+) catalytic subunit
LPGWTCAVTEKGDIDMRNLEVSIGSLKIKNPIMPDREHLVKKWLRFLILTSWVPFFQKSITKDIRKGNPTPRICETMAGMIYSIGIQSKGLDYYQKITVPFYSQFSSPLILSVSADSIDEFAEVSEKITVMKEVATLELNISGPNLKNNGLAVWNGSKCYPSASEWGPASNR